MKYSPLILFLFAFRLAAQDTAGSFKLSAYVETYYSYDFSKPANRLRPDFIYSHKRHNEVNLNLGFVKATYTNAHVRSNLALMAGNYSTYNLAHEGALRFIFEANVGVRVSRRSALWLDAGVLPSHVGFESAVGADCPTLSRSILADNSPYYETGVRLSYASADKKWYTAALLLNGWQRIRPIPGNKTPAFGTQITFKPSGRMTLNWSTFVGNEKPDTLRQWRYFSNMYGEWKVFQKTTVTAGFDIGAEQKAVFSEAFAVWHTAVLIVRQQLARNWWLAARGEYYYDPGKVIITPITFKGVEIAGYSVNIDYAPFTNLLIRVEARSLSNRGEIFTGQNGSTSNNFCVTASLAYKIKR